MDPKLYVWDSDLDTVQFFNFETGRGEQDEYIAQSGDLENDASDLDKYVKFLLYCSKLCHTCLW